MQDALVVQQDGIPEQTARRDYYAERKEQAGRCMDCARTGIGEDAVRCPRCRRRQRKGTRSRRSARRDAGLCAECGKVPSAAYRCAGCVIRRGRVPRTMSKPLTSAVGDQWRPDNEGWVRYRGKGKRGAPGAAANDEQDLTLAADALEKGREAFRYARSPEVLALPRIQRRGALSEATALIALVARFCDDVVDRNSEGGGSQ